MFVGSTGAVGREGILQLLCFCSIRADPEVHFWRSSEGGEVVVAADLVFSTFIYFSLF